MSADDFQQLLKQLNYGMVEVAKKKQAFSQFTQEIVNLEQSANTDPEARKKLEALAQYQQSERYAELRERAEKELAELQLQFNLLKQEAVKEAASLLNHGEAENLPPVVFLPKANKRRIYI
ncbi:hypothetical protein GE278_23455 (plasmid) [Enterobacteriaceae bacterium Kacie_13]|nr:hypothetical protein GE278_23455 [Enterobacteriaceae bacterium Kacie_13]